MEPNNRLNIFIIGLIVIFSLILLVILLVFDLRKKRRVEDEDEDEVRDHRCSTIIEKLPEKNSEIDIIQKPPIPRSRSTMTFKL